MSFDKVFGVYNYYREMDMKVEMKVDMEVETQDLLVELQPLCQFYY